MPAFCPTAKKHRPLTAKQRALAADNMRLVGFVVGRLGP
jgi:hypothetical protein